MTRLFIRVTLPSLRKGAGLVEEYDRDTTTPATIINTLREYARQQYTEAAAILTAQDHEFQVDVVEGSIIQRYVTTLQQTTRPASASQQPYQAPPTNQFKDWAK